MNSLVANIPQSTEVRQWQARLSLNLACRQSRTSLVRSEHCGPLRVQRPFYPERNGTCHIYILHPPGGLVIGDELRIDASLAIGAQGLLTTPSAGKVYGAGGQSLTQQQHIHFCVDEGAVLEWLPQETIVFNGAHGELSTRVALTGDAKFFGWDIIRLGRIAGNAPFVEGSCTQKIEIVRDGRLVFNERNNLSAGDQFMQAQWGMQGANTVATLLATMDVSRAIVDELLEQLKLMAPEQAHCWGATQKKSLFILRYLGNCVVTCRKGYTLAWQFLRNEFCGKDAVIPRIWNT